MKIYKKIILTVVTLLLAVTLVACGEKNDRPPFANEFTGSIPKWALEQNTNPEINVDSNVTLEDTLMNKYDSAETSMIHEFIRVRKEDQHGQLKEGIYDLKNNVEVIAPTFTAINSATDLVYDEFNNIKHVVVKVIHDDGRVGIFNLTTKEYVAELTEANNIVVMVNNHLRIETHYLSTDDGPVYKYYKYEIDSKTLEITKTSLDIENTPPNIDNAIHLGNVGHPGHSYKIDSFDGVIYGFKDNKLLYRKELDIDPAQTTFLIGNYYYVQYVMPVANDTNNYNVLIGNNKFKVETYRFNLLTGNGQTIKTDYLFDTGSVALKDNNGNFTHALLKASQIKDKLPKFPSNMIFDNNLKPVFNTTNSRYNQTLTKVNDNLFYIKEGNGIKALLDKNLNTILDLDGYNTAKLIEVDGKLYLSLRRNTSNAFGVMDLDGNIVIPFDYTTEFIYFSNGKAIVRNVNKAVYSRIGLDGVEEDFIPGENIHLNYFSIDFTEQGDGVTVLYDASGKQLMLLEDYVEIVLHQTRAIRDTKGNLIGYTMLKLVNGQNHVFFVRFN